MTNADTALRWLGRTPPDHDEARDALTCIKEDGYRASDVFEGIRALFGRSGVERYPIDLNRVVLSVTDSLQEELHRHSVVTHYELTTELSPVIGHGIQLREVVFNPVNNAVEAMVSTTSESRALRLRTAVCGRNEIAVSVQKLGTGN